MKFCFQWRWFWLSVFIDCTLESTCVHSFHFCFPRIRNQSKLCIWSLPDIMGIMRAEHLVYWLALRKYCTQLTELALYKIKQFSRFTKTVWPFCGVCIILYLHYTWFDTKKDEYSMNWAFSQRVYLYYKK